MSRKALDKYSPFTDSCAIWTAGGNTPLCENMAEGFLLPCICHTDKPLLFADVNQQTHTYTLPTLPT